MTHSEAEEFIRTVIGQGDSMDVREVMKRYPDKTLREALEDYYFEEAPFGDGLEHFIHNKERG